MSPEILSRPGPTPFRVDDVTPAAKPIWTESLTSSLSARFKREIIFRSYPEKQVINARYDSISKRYPGYVPDPGECNRCHPLIEAVQTAFSQHRPLILSPDCLWLVIAQGFGHHITANAEAFRHRLVGHQGKRSLTQKLDDWTLDDFKVAIAGLSAQIREATDPVLHENLTCDFSTTTLESRTASEVALMDTYSSYFKYEMQCVCGIPAITLRGSVMDWQRIRDRVEMLATFELSWWVERLRPILDEFIETAKGRPNREFWQAIYKPRKAYATDLVTGWIADLFPYLDDPPKRRRSMVFEWGRDHWILSEPDAPNNTFRRFATRGIATGAFPSGLSSVPVEIEFPDRSRRSVDLVAGFFGIAQGSDDLALSPAIGWCVAAPPPPTPVLIRWRS
jgi:hypothetical protein